MLEPVERGPMLRGARAYVFAVVVVAVFAAAGWIVRDSLAEADIGMTFLLAVVIVAYCAPIGPSLVSAGLSVAVFDFLFVRPFYTFAVREAQYLVTFAAMAVVGITVSSLAARLRDRERAAHEARLQVEAERVRNSLLSSISHDVRTPLGSLMGSATALRDHNLDESNRRELLDTICEEAHYLQRILDNLLQMTRVADDAMKVQVDWHLPEEVVGVALGRLAHLLGERKVDVVIDEAAGLARFDAVLIELVLVNLIENSAKYDPRGGGIEIEVRVAAEELVWEVRDDGPGLPEGEELRIFDKFYRGRGRTDRGSGLGLTIAKAIVEAHGGRMWGQSRAEGAGAVLGFSLPHREAVPTVSSEEAA